MSSPTPKPTRRSPSSTGRWKAYVRAAEHDPEVDPWAAVDGCWREGRMIRTPDLLIRTNPDMAKIAFLGAGAMGQAIIPNLLRGGHTVRVYNRTIDKARRLEAKGATVAATVRDAVQNVDAVFSMVIDDDASRAVWAGPDGVLNSAAPGTLAVESSTVSNEWLGELGRLAAAKDLRFLDCPVAGRPDA